MLKHHGLLLAFCALLFSLLYTSSAHAAPSGKSAFIKDELTTFMRSGAGDNYRLIGTVNAGDAVTLASGQANNGYMEIIDKKGRKGWVKSKYISTSASLKSRFNTLSATLAKTEQNLRDLQQTLPELKKTNQQLQAQNNQLQSQLDALKAKEQQQLNHQQQLQTEEKKTLLTYGGAIALGSLILGVLLTLMLSRRKRRDSWA